MKRVNFYLRKNRSKTSTVYLCIRKGRNNSYRKSLGFKISPSDWDKKKMRIKSTAKMSDIALINSYLDDLELHLNHFLTWRIVMKEEVNLSEVRDFVLKYLYPDRTSGIDVLTFLRNYIKRIENQRNTNTGKPLSPFTVSKYIILYKLFKEYKILYQSPMTFTDIDLTFYDNFVSFLYSKGYATNTVGKFISAVKCILNDAVLKGVSDNLIYKDRRFKTPSEAVQSVYLTRNELEKIRNLNLNGAMADSRDLFLIGCYTGLRYSDFIRIEKHCIADNFITLIQKKTGQQVIIPIHRYLKEIFERKDIVKPLSNSELNRNIKQICLKAGIKQKILKTMTKGGKTQSQALEKWQCVTTHTARRTFATNLFLDGVPSLTIMKITGHKSESAFLRYVKISQLENARILQKHWRKINYQ